MKVPVLVIASLFISCVVCGSVVHRLKVGVHRDCLEYDEERVLAVLQEMREILKIEHSPEDKGADVEFELASIETFDNVSNIVNNGFEFTLLEGLGYDVVIVSEINWCGSFNLRALGCAPRPGNFIVVETYRYPYDGILWAHEFGHNCGLSHRNGLGLLMSGSMGDSNKIINEPERSAFEARVVVQGLSEALALEPQVSNTKDENDINESEDESAGWKNRIDELVKKSYFHGPPLLELSKIDRRHSDYLFSLLSEEENDLYWPNIVTAIGIAGSERDQERLIKFIEGGSGQISREEYDAKMAAVVALGYRLALGRDENEDKILKFLGEGIKPTGFFVRRKVDWTASHFKNSSEVSLQYSAICSIALGVSGEEKAAEILRENLKKNSNKMFEAMVDPTMSEALKENIKVREIGLLKYLAD